MSPSLVRWSSSLGELAPSGDAVAGRLLTATLQATVLLTLGLLLSACLRRSSSAVRHRMWSLVFCCLLLIPVISQVLPSLVIPLPSIPFGDAESAGHLAATATRPSLAGTTVSHTSDAPSVSRRAHDDKSAAAVDTQDRRSTAAPESSDWGVFDRPTAADPVKAAAAEFAAAPPAISTASAAAGWLRLIAIVWFAGMLLSLSPWLAGIVRCRRLCRACRTLEDASGDHAPWVELLRECSARLGLRRHVKLLMAPGETMPMTCGVLRPTVVLPADAAQWNASRRRLVLLHELAHVKRWDVLQQSLARLACAAYWFHPLVWLALRRLRHERELACDDCVLATGQRPSRYASVLLALYRTHGAPNVTAALAMAVGKLEYRVRAALDQRRLRRPVGRRAGIAMFLLAGGIAASVAMVAVGAADPPHSPADEDKGGPAGASPSPGSPAANPPGNDINAFADDPLPPRSFVRFGTSRYRHGTRIGGLAVSPDGKTAFAATDSHYLGVTRAYDLIDGRAKFRIAANAPMVEALSLSPDGHALALREDRNVILHDAATGDERRRIRLPPANPRTITNWIEFSPDGKSLAVSSDGKAVELIDLADGKVLHTFSHEKAVYAAAFSPDGKRLATGGYERKGTSYVATLWDVASGERVRRLPAGKSGLRTLDFSPDGTMLAAGGDDGRLRLWQTESGDLKREFPADGRRIRSVVFAPDGKTIAAAGDTIRIYDVASGDERLRIDHQAIGLHFTADGRTLTAAVDGAIHQWQADTGRPLTPQQAGDSAIDQLIATRDGRRIITHDQADCTHIWDRSGRHLRQLPLRSSSGVAVSPDGRFLVTAVVDPSVSFPDPAHKNWTHDGARIRVYDLKQDRFADRFEAFPGGADDLAFSADGRTLLTVDHRDGGVRVWDFASGRMLREFIALRETERTAFYPITRAALSPDGKTLAVAMNRLDRTSIPFAAVPVRLWDVASGLQQHELQGHINHVEDLAFSSDSRMLVTVGVPAGGDTAVFVWDVAAGATIARLQHGLPFGASSAAISPDGRTLATALPDGTIRVWETASWQPRVELRGHRDRVSALWYVSSGVLLSAGMDTMVLGWNVRPTTAAANSQSLAEALRSLAGENAAKAYAAQGRLLAEPDEAVKLIAKRVAPAKPLDRKQIARLIAQLDDKQFSVREQATRELRRFGAAAESALRAAAQDSGSAETRGRAENLLRLLKADAPAPDDLLAERSVELLEWIATPAARRHLASLAAGDEHSTLTHSAAAALARLGQ